MTVEDLVSVADRCLTINILDEFTNRYVDYGEATETKRKELNLKEVSMVSTHDDDELNIYVKESENSVR